MVAVAQNGKALQYADAALADSIKTEAAQLGMPVELYAHWLLDVRLVQVVSSAAESQGKIALTCISLDGEEVFSMEFDASEIVREVNTILDDKLGKPGLCLQAVLGDGRKLRDVDPWLTLREIFLP